MSDFALHPRLTADTVFVAQWPLSQVLLMNDARYPWLILVPQRQGLTELHDLVEEDAALLMTEVSRASRALKQVANPHKLNIGALGNLVPQLHIHIVARNPGDAAWPGPVWGVGESIAYRPAALEALKAALTANF